MAKGSAIAELSPKLVAGALEIPAIPCALRQRVLANAFARCFRQVIDERDVTRDLKVGQAALTPLDEAKGTERLSWPEADKGLDILIREPVRDADDRAFNYGRVVAESAFDLEGGNVLTTAPNTVLLATAVIEVPILVAPADVAGLSHSPSKSAALAAGLRQ